MAYPLLTSRMIRGPFRGSLSISMSARLGFFDRGQVIRAMDAATHQAMSHSAARIRRIAQTSMRYVTEPRRGSTRVRQFSQPKEPPRAVRPHPWVRKNLLFYYDRSRRSAVIGPVGFPRGSGAPNKLEFGGTVSIRNRRRRTRYIGGGGEVRLDAPAGPSVKPTVDQFGRTRQIAYARLTSGAMVSRANRLNEQLYGPRSQTRSMAARPFMGPALREETPRMPRLWANTVKG